MAEKIQGEGFRSCLDEETGGGEVSPEAPPPEPTLRDRAWQAWDDGVETVREGARSVRDAARDAQRAVDLEGNIEQLGVGDSLEVKVSGGARLGLGVAGSEALEVRRLQDGRYLVAGSGELGVSFGQKVALGSKALEELGVEQSGGARVEFTCDTAAEAAAAARAMRNTAMRQAGIPIGDVRDEQALLARKLSAIELGGKTSFQADLKLGIEARAGVQGDHSVRLEFSKEGTELAVKSGVTVDGGAPLRINGLLPRTSSTIPPMAGVSFGQGLKGSLRVETETRLKLEGDVKTALAGARSTVTFSADAKASALVKSAGREVKVSFETNAAQAKAVLAAVALQDGSKLAPLLDTEATLEARAFREKGGEATAGLSAGVVGGYLGLEARLRDVDDGGAVRVKATAAELLGYLQSE
jgi:hypothetical protein